MTTMTKTVFSKMVADPKGNSPKGVTVALLHTDNNLVFGYELIKNKPQPNAAERTLNREYADWLLFAGGSGGIDKLQLDPETKSGYIPVAALRKNLANHPSVKVPKAYIDKVTFDSIPQEMLCNMIVASILQNYKI